MAPSLEAPVIMPKRPLALRVNARSLPGGGAMRRFLDAQVINTARHADALRAFRRDEFGRGPASPSAAHIEAVNRLVGALSRVMHRRAAAVQQAAAQAGRGGSAVSAVLTARDRAADTVRVIEQVWDFFFEMFGQRQSWIAPWLLAADRVAADCYAAVYTGLGAARTIPSPPPFTFMATGFTPSTYRRGIPLSRLGKQNNPFPIIQLPFHRLVNPWTLGAIHHEVSHNIQSDLGLWQVTPVKIRARLTENGIQAETAAAWARWHKEIWADLCAVLLGGPAIVDSLVDVVARGRAPTLSFNPAGVHPTPYLRVFISLELLRRMGFPKTASVQADFWRRLYPHPERSTLPPSMMASFSKACELVVDTICYQPYPQMGGRSLAQTMAFRPAHVPMVLEAAGRLAGGVDPGILPPRFLVGAARSALDRRLAPPGIITRNFYTVLADR